jgi:hypothetical protein
LKKQAELEELKSEYGSLDVENKALKTELVNLKAYSDKLRLENAALTVLSYKICSFFSPVLTFFNKSRIILFFYFVRRLAKVLVVGIYCLILAFSVVIFHPKLSIFFIYGLKALIYSTLSGFSVADRDNMV